MPINLDFDQEATYKTIKDLCKIGPRVSGSEAEIRAILLIEERFRSAGLSTIQILGHEHAFYDTKTATVSLPDESIKIFGMPCWMSASTILGGLESQTKYIGSFEMIQNLRVDDIKNRLVITLFDDRSKEAIDAWKRLYAMNPDAVLFLDMERDSAPRSFFNKDLIPSFSRIPSIVVSASKAKILRDHFSDSRLKIVIKGSKRTGNVQSIQCKLKGKSSDTVLICAHHDTHPLSPGATDDAAGVAILLEIARILAQRKPNLSYQFVSFGGEELGLRGSWAYASRVKLDEIKLCINLDSIGELPGMLLASSAGNKEMIDWISSLAMKNHYPARCIRTSTSGGTNIVFAANGIPTIHLASHGITSEKVSHSQNDTVDLLTPFTIDKIGRFAYSIIEDLEISKGIPFPREMPRDLLQAAKQHVIESLS